MTVEINDVLLLIAGEGDGEGVFKEAEGTGLGEGEGAKDISDQLESEDQILGAQRKGQEPEEKQEPDKAQPENEDKGGDLQRRNP